MHKIENILLGIALILFGIASMLVFNHTEWAICEILGIFSPIVGLIVVIVGSVYEGKSKSNTDDEE